MLDLIADIAKVKEDIVFVGSVPLWYSNLITSSHDIDIVVNDLDGLEVFGKIDTWESTSPMSISGKRACIKREDCTIDIFIESNLPEFTIKNGIKFQTPDNLKSFFDSVIDSSEGEFRDRMIEKKRKISLIV
jgi:hypothetical protein